MSAPSPGTLHGLVDAVDGGFPCLVLPGGEVSYGALAQRSSDLAHGLHALGIGRSDRVALWLPNGPAWLEAFLACTRLGAVAVAVNTRFRSRELADILPRAGCSLLIMAPQAGSAALADALAAVPAERLTGLRAVVTTGDPAALRVPGGIPVIALDALRAAGPRVQDGRPGDGCVVFTTSGTTGLPKLVLHAQSGVARHGREVAAAFGLDGPRERALVALPLCGVFGFSLAVATLAAGRPIVLPEAFDPSESARLLRDEAVTVAVGTNEMLDRMLDARAEERPFPALRFFGHATFNPALVDLPAKAERRGVTLRGLFGMSECLALFAIRPADAPAEPRAVAGGVPISPQGRVRARNTATGALVPPGQPGEIELTGPSLMLGYLGDAAATARAMTPDGWLRTGDLGQVDGDGGFTHLARMGDVLRVAGQLVDPREVEAVLLEDPAIAAAQVVEAARREGARPVAFVVLKPDAALDEAALIARCRASLAAFKAPVRVLALPAFPTTDGPNGTKVRRAALRDMATAAVSQGAVSREKQPRDG
ncbi:MAG: AMP-binding protein [Alphaproteobacteria bacterium]|nr:AMP-binding protein [Alphaproteobacteria bacterium]